LRQFLPLDGRCTQHASEDGKPVLKVVVIFEVIVPRCVRPSVQEENNDVKKASIGRGNSGRGVGRPKGNPSLDVNAKTDQLLKDHPEAATTRSIVEKTFREESADAGVQPRKL
jgi:hypothetical protein